MAKHFILWLLLIFTSLSLGCAKVEMPLNYQSNGFETDATLDLNEKSYSVHIEKSTDGAMMMKFISPSTIGGTTVEKTKDGLFFSIGNVHVPIKENSNITAEALRLFELDPKWLVSNTSYMLGGVKTKRTEFNCPFGKAVLFISEDTDLPVLAEATINGTELKITFSNFTVAAPETGK